MRIRASLLLLTALLLSQNSQALQQQTVAPTPPSGSTAYARMLAELDRLRDADVDEYRRMRTALVLAVQMTLGRLGFGAGPFSGTSDEETTAATRRFEVARRLPVTGNPLSPAIFGRIMDEGDRVLRADTTPGPSLNLFGDSQWEQGYFLAEGPWVQDPPSPSADAISLTCRRERAECILAYARLVRLFGLQLQSKVETYRVASWDKGEIVSVPLSYPCARYLLRIGRTDRSVTLRRSTLSLSGPCSSMSPGDLVARLATQADETLKRQREQNTIFGLYELTGDAKAALRSSPGQPGGSR